ncbi:regulatory protein RecX [Sphingomonas sp.]|uniref:regulatory protein RecX n=1 Tax=Sphingomonas sp. TaxID=28214 RepID=UPI0031D67C92
MRRNTHPGRSPAPPLDPEKLERLALRYVERFATTRGKLAAYLARKVRERGWEGEPADPVAIAERFAELGYVDDRLYAESKASAMARRGLGARRVRDALRHAGVQERDAEALAPELDGRARATAVEFARKRRIGPFAAAEADRVTMAKQVGAMVRAGHAPELAWKIARMPPGENVEPLLDED